MFYKHIISVFILSLALIFVVFRGQTQTSDCDSDLPEHGSRDDILIVVNDNSLDSCAVGRYYVTGHSKPLLFRERQI
jgi:hypothetical protein